MRRADPRFSGWTDAAIVEQIVGVAAASRAPDPFGWTLVGEVHDHASDERREVWWHPATDRVRIRPVPWVGALRANPVGDGTAYYDGTRMTWVDRATGRELGPDRPQ